MLFSILKLHKNNQDIYKYLQEVFNLTTHPLVIHVIVADDAVNENEVDNDRMDREL